MTAALCSSLTLAALCQSLMAAPALIPRPMRLEPGQGAWTLGPGARIIAPGEASVEAWKLSDALAAPLGWRLPVLADGRRAGDIVMRLNAARTDLGDEGYELAVAADGVIMTARRPAGLFYAAQTLRQLLPAAAWREAPAGREAWTAPCVRITDQPRFGWRGLMLDTARHFIQRAALRQIIDAMAMHKLNRLQLHLTDDQGWRIELRSFPLLTARSSWRDGTLIGSARQQPQSFSNVPHGGYYSQEDLREIVAYAAARHITVVPEIEMPGHVRGLLSVYPEYAVFPDKAAGMGLWRQWGVSRDVLAPRPAALAACRRILDEVCELFPSQWIHTGGDEAPRDQWRQSPEIQQMIKSLGLANEDELQAWFTAEMSRHLASKGRRLVGWDEVLHGAKLTGPPDKTTPDPSAIVMSWRGEKGGQTAAAAGHDVIMAPTQWTYLDYLQGPASEEPLAIGGSVPLARAQAYEPVPAGLSEGAARRVLGASAQVWTEYMPSSDQVMYMAFPRVCALSESFWSPREGRQFSDFITRLEQHESRLRAAGLNYRPLARRVSWPDESGRILAAPQDAVINGTEVVRRPDGALANWKDPFTTISWRVQVPSAGEYRVRALVAAANPGWIEAIIAGRTLRAALPAETAELGSLRLEPGAYLLVLRAGGSPEIRGVELNRAR